MLFVVGIGLLFLMLGKLNLLHTIVQITYINRVKIDESDPERKPTFNLLKLPFIFLLDLGLYFVSIGKTVSIKIRALKVVSATLLLVYFSSLKKSTCEAWKNVFYFTSKTLFVLGKITCLYFRY